MKTLAVLSVIPRQKGDRKREKRASRVMFSLGVLLAGITLAFPSTPAEGEVSQSPSVIVMRGATLFDSEGGEMRTDQAILIRGERLEYVGPQTGLTAVPEGAQEVDVRGKFIIPGLIDAHIHLAHQLNLAHMTGDEVLPMYLAAGVTSLRDVGDTVTTEKVIARLADTHPEYSPAIFLGSPLIDGAQPFHSDIGTALTDTEKVPAFVDDMAAWGVITLKIYVGTERPVGQRVIQEAHQRGLMVTGHLGLYSAQDAVADGIDCLEHIWSVFDYVIPDGPRPDGYRARMDFTIPKARDLIADLKKQKVRVDPTLTIFKNALLLTDQPSVYESPDLARVPGRLHRRWTEHRQNLGLKAETLALRQGEFQKYQELTGILYREGITILAGTDTPEPFVVPGLALLEELELLVESGLPPAAALQAGTINNAGAIKQEGNLGSLSKGKVADLVILTANPLDDIRNVRKTEKIIHRGVISEPAQLLNRVPVE